MSGFRLQVVSASARRASARVLVSSSASESLTGARSLLTKDRSPKKLATEKLA